MKINDKLTANSITAAPATSGTTYTTLTSSTENVLNLKQWFQVGKSFEITNDGGIRCLRDGYIEVSAKVHWQTLAASGLKWLEIWQNAVKKAQVPQTLTARGMLICPTICFEVSVGDVIYLNVSGAADDKIREQAQYTSITASYI